MNLQSFQSALAEKIRSIPLLAGLAVREEELGNIIETVEQDILKDKFCVVIGTATYTDEAPDAFACYGTSRVTISIFEDPELNRVKSNRPTFLNAAQEIAKALKLFRPDIPGAGSLTSPAISSPRDLGDGVISVDVTFETRLTL